MTDRSAAALEAQESFEVHKEKNIDLLHAKAVGLLGVLFLTVTGAAPMSAMLGNVPFGAGFGNGIYLPAAFLLATIVLTIFSVGFAAMAQRVSSVGGFYSYISLGLGRDMGMAAGMASFVSYSVFEASLCGLFAYFANGWVQTDLGPELPRREAFGQDPRCCAYPRGDHPVDFRRRCRFFEHVEVQPRGSQR